MCQVSRTGKLPVAALEFSERAESLVQELGPGLMKRVVGWVVAVQGALMCRPH